MCSDQRSLGFRFGHCHVQLTGVNHLHRTTSNVQGQKEKLKVQKVVLTILYKTIEMIIVSVGREVNLLIGYLKGKVCIAHKKGYKKAFLIQREWFPRF